MKNDISALNLAKSKDTEVDTSSNLRSAFGVSEDISNNSANNVKNTDNSSDYLVEEYNDIPEGYVEYIAKDGETLESIAKNHDMTLNELKKVNTDLTSDEISEGVRLFVKKQDGSKSAGGSGGSGGSGGGGSANDNVSASPKNGTGGGSNNASTNGGSSNDVASGSPSDSGSLNFENLSESGKKSLSSLQSLLDKYGITGGTFTKIYDLVNGYANDMGLSLSSKDDIATVLDSFLKEHNEYQDIDINDLVDMIFLYNKLLNDKSDASSEEPEEQYYESILKNILSGLGYSDTEMAEFSLLDMTKICNENREKIENVLKEQAGLIDFDLDELLYSALISHYVLLIPTDESADLNEVLDKYTDEAIDILAKIGYEVSGLYDLNPYELVNTLRNNESNITELFINYGINIFDSEFGFNDLFTNTMSSIAYKLALEDADKFSQYMDANMYSEETKRIALEYFKKGNTNSALYTLKLEELINEGTTNDERIKAIDNEIKELAIKEPKYLEYLGSGYSYDEAIKLLSNDNSDIKELLDEKNELEARNNELGNERYQTKVAIETNSYQYLEVLRDSNEYKDNLSTSEGIISYNNDIVTSWMSRLDSNNIIYADEDSKIASTVDITNELYSFTDIITRANEESEGDTDLFIELVNNNFLFIDNKSDLNSIEMITQDGNDYVIRVKRNYDKGYVNIRYNSGNNSYQYDFEQDGKIVLSTSNINDYSSVNYFELFRQIEARDEFAGMSREEIFSQVFDWTETDMSQFDDPFAVAKMCYMYLDDAEIDDYIYLYNTKGSEEANHYLETKRDSIHQKIGMQAALNDIDYIMNGDNTFRTGIVGLENGVQGWVDNVYTFFSRDVTMTPTEYESEYLLSLLTSFATPLNLSDSNLDEEILAKIENPESATYLDYYYATGKITEDQYNNLKDNNDYKELAEYAKEHPAKLRYSYMIGQNVGNMLPSVLGSLLMSPLGGITVAGHFIGAGQATASMLMFAGAFGSSYKEAIRNDHDVGTANLYATLSAFSEVATEYFLGRIPGIGRISESISPAVYQNIGQLLGIRAINLIKDVGGEILEESLQIWIDYALKKGVLGEEIDLSGWPEEQKETMIVTTFTTLILGLPSSIATLTTDMINGPLVKIDENTTIKLSFKEILELNEKYVNSETGEVDLDGLKQAVRDMKGIDTEEDIANIKALKTDEEKIDSAKKLRTDDAKREIIKDLSYGDAIEFYRNEEGVETILIDESKLSDSDSVSNMVNQLHALLPNEDISHFNGTLLYSSEYDLLNYLAINGPAPNIGNTSLEEMLNIDVMQNIKNMENSGISHDDIMQYVNSYKESRNLVLNYGIVGYDETYKRSEVVNELNKIFQDTSVLGEEINRYLFVDELSIDEIKDRLSTHYSQNEIDDFFNNNPTGKFINLLTKDEIASLVYYSGAGYYLLNDYMRKGENNDSDLQQHVDNINSIIDKYNSLNPTTPLLLYRGDTISFAKCSPELMEILDGVGKFDEDAITEALQNAIGLSFTTDNYFSTSPGYNTSHASKAYKNIVFEIVAPPGTNGAYVNMLSSFYNLENEYLLGAGTDMRILNVYKGSDGKVHVQTMIENVDSNIDIDASNNLEIGIDSQLENATNDYERLNIINQLDANTDKAKYIKYLSFGEAVVFKADENGNESIIIDESKLNGKSLDDVTSILYGMFEGVDMYSSNGVTLYNAEFDLFNDAYMSPSYPTTNNNSMDAILAINTIDMIEKLQKLGYSHDLIQSYIDSLMNAKDIIYGGNIIGLDEENDYEGILTKLNDLFGDNIDLAKDLNELLKGGYSFNEALQELVKQGYPTEEIEDFFNNTTEGQYINSLTEDEIKAIVYYCAEGYESINEFMRNATEEEKANDYYVSNLRSALAKYALEGMNYYLYRGDSIMFGANDPVLSSLLDGIEEDDVEGINDAIQQAIGLTFTTDSFYSTSPAYGTSFAEYNDVVLEIIAPEGTQGAYVNTLGNYNNENEFLLADGQNLKILNSYIGEDGSVHIQLIVEPEVEQQDTSNTIDTVDWDSLDWDTDFPTNEEPEFNKPMSDLTLDMLDQIDDAINQDGAMENAAYYELLNIIGKYYENGETIPTDDIVSLINHCKELREAIVNASYEEVEKMLSDMYGITDQEVIEEIVNSLTGGEQFVEGKVGDGINWDNFVSYMEGLFKSKINEEIASGKEPVFWSGFDDEYHESMNGKFTTIEGTTIGGYLMFLDALYSNWNKEGSPKLEHLWELLSDVYADGVLKATNPETGTYYDNIKYLYPSSKNASDSFGDLFKTVEFPAILKSGTVKTLTLSKTDPETMEIIDTIEIDISDISTYYINNLSDGNSNTSLDQEVFNMLLDKINS